MFDYSLPPSLPQEKIAEILSTPFCIGDVRLKNRFCMGPMDSSHLFKPSGGFTDESIQYFAERAKGGFALIFTGAMSSDSKVDTFKGFGAAILDNPEEFRATSLDLNERLDTLGARAFAQISMGLGRIVPGLAAPSVLPVFRNPEEFSPQITVEEIRARTDALVRAARVAQSGGFAGVEIHALHWGFLLDQFEFAFMNKRLDQYGGRLENRLRIARDLLRGIKQECGDAFPVSMRLGLKSFFRNYDEATLTGADERGRSLEESIEVARLLESYGYDALNVDTGTCDSYYYACPPMYVPKGYAAGFARGAKQAVKIPVLAGSRMNEPTIAAQGIATGDFDAVVLSRPSLADPALPNKLLAGQPASIRPCLACNQACISRVLQGKRPSCTVNPQAMREVSHALRPCFKALRVVVAGGGPAGMEAARVAAMRGHEVALYEKTDQLGGKLIPGGSHAFKRESRELKAWYQAELEKLPIAIHLGRNMTAADLKALGANAIILAMGSEPFVPAVPGLEDSRVTGCLEALANPERIGERVAVIGGGLVGCELALDYGQHGKKVTLVNSRPQLLLAGITDPLPNAQMIPDLLAYYKVRVLNGQRLHSIESGKVRLVANDAVTELDDLDSIVMATGFRPVPSMAKELTATGAAVYQIGDGRKVSSLMQAIWDGFEVGNNI